MTTATKTCAELIAREEQILNGLAGMRAGFWGTIEDVRDLKRELVEVRKQIEASR